MINHVSFASLNNLMMFHLTIALTTGCTGRNTLGQHFNLHRQIGAQVKKTGMLHHKNHRHRDLIHVFMLKHIMT